jgi:4-amino-4-deoxy-L-arabinose transferase-like glycosyltransferase
MASGIPMARSLVRVKPRRRHLALPWWTAQAWGSIGVVALSLGITCWWLTQDHTIPIYDAGRHLSFAFYAFEELKAGHIVHALTLSVPYPPLAYVVGDLGILVGGIDVAPPIVAENLVFVPLLALGCYHVARMAFDRTAGLLAVAFALCSPLVMAQFHVFMTDAPETAMVAVALWAILATDGFSRVENSVLAGVAVGLGMLTKEPFVFYAAGPVAVTAVRGGVKAWRGLLAFTLVVLVIALPWYVHEYAQIKALGSGATEANSRRVSDIAPPPLSIGNLEWYFWVMVNNQLYAPLFAFSAIGWLWTMVGFVRRRPVSRFAPELAVGVFVAWLAITETYVHDTRYGMPLLAYLAIFGVGWLTRLPRTGRMLAATILVLVCAANVAGTSFGAGKLVSVSLPGRNVNFLQQPGLVTFYSDRGYLVARPERDGDMIATLRTLRRDGVRAIVLERSSQVEPDFSASGMFALDGIAKLGTIFEDRVPVERLTPAFAVLHHAPIEAGEAPPCVRLSDGTGVWIRLGNPYAPGARDFCPSRHPQLYG